MSSVLSAKQVRDILQQNGVLITDSQWDLLKQWHDLLIQQNQKLNLISRKDTDRIWEKHLLHCFALLACRSLPEGSEVCDFGTGGGLPGIPLAIIRPDSRFTLIDSIGKKIHAVQTILADLQLSNVEAVLGRGEDLGKQRKYSRRFSVFTAKAVAPLKSLEFWTRHLRKKKAVLHAYKGGDLGEEIQEVMSYPYIRHIEETLLALDGYPLLAEDQKKIVTLDFV